MASMQVLRIKIDNIKNIFLFGNKPEKKTVIHHDRAMNVLFVLIANLKMKRDKDNEF